MIIAISRQRGSGGAFVGRSVAERLGFRYIDRELLRHAAEYLHGHEEAESEPAAQGWLDRLGISLASGGDRFSYVPPHPEVLYEGDLFDIERTLIQDLAAEQNAVVVGRGASQTLKGRESVLSVFLHAPEAWRVERTRQIYSITDQRAAQKLVRESDRNRAAFVRQLNDTEWTDARGYDLTLDTSTLGFEASVEVILRLAGTRPRT